MFVMIKFVGVIVFSHVLYDLMKDDRQKWVSNIRKFVVKKWHEAEQHVTATTGNGEVGRRIEREKGE